MIVMEGISKSYPARSGQALEVLSGVNLHIRSGSYAAFVGPSGSGKSTLMHLIGCLDLPTDGRYRLDGTEVQGLDERELCRIRRDKIGFVFQGYQLMRRMTAAENVAFPLLLRGINERERIRRACEALERVGLNGREQHRPGELSGGQQQRVAVARALCACQKPRLLLCDEPTGALDTDSRNDVLDLLDDLHRDGHTIVVITHDPFVASRACCRFKVAQGGVKPVISSGQSAYPATNRAGG